MKYVRLNNLWFTSYARNSSSERIMHTAALFLCFMVLWERVKIDNHHKYPRWSNCPTSKGDTGQHLNRAQLHMLGQLWKCCAYFVPIGFSKGSSLSRSRIPFCCLAVSVWVPAVQFYVCLQPTSVDPGDQVLLLEINRTIFFCQSLSNATNVTKD